MSQKLFEIAKAIYNELFPPMNIWIILPNAMMFGTLPSSRDVIVAADVEKRDDAAAKWAAAFIEKSNPGAVEEEILTLVGVTVIFGSEHYQIPIAHILPMNIMAWGPGQLPEDLSIITETLPKHVHQPK